MGGRYGNEKKQEMTGRSCFQDDIEIPCLLSLPHSLTPVTDLEMPGDKLNVACNVF